MTAVSVVICCYTEERWDDLAEAVKSVAGQTLAPAELLIVVDHNAVLLRRAEETFADGSTIRVLANERTAGLSGARNTGVWAAHGEIVAFLDDDATADPWWLAEMLAPYADPDVVASGGKAAPVWPDGKAPDRLTAELYWIVGCAYTGLPVEPGEVRNLMGCTMSFRREPVRRLGGFTEDIGRTASLPLGCEETELCIRLRQKIPGAKVILRPGATIRHRVGEGRTSWRYLRRRSWSEGVSKAAVSRLAGPRDALSTERSYLRSVIPRGLLRELRSGNTAGVSGLLLATSAASAGYVRGRFRRPATVFTPSTVHTVDVADTAASRPEEGEILVRSGDVVLGSARRSEEIDDLVGLLPEQLLDRPPRPETLPRVSVVLATAGDVENVRRCVDSVLATAYPDLEVLVVDNHRSAREELRNLADVRYLREPVPGASRARNLGAREATGSVLAFIDDDAVADPRWLGELVAELARPDSPCVTGLVVPLRLDTQAQAWFEAFGGFGKGYHRRILTSDEPYLLSPGMFGSGNNMAWRREAFLALGGFDERLGPGRRTRSGEDLDLYLRLITSGGRITYTPHAVVWHEHRTSEPELRRQLRGYGTGLAAMYLLHARRRGGLRELISVMPQGLRVFADRGSEEDGPGYPRRLLAEELRGMFAAPLALFRERAR